MRLIFRLADDDHLTHGVTLAQDALERRLKGGGAPIGRDDDGEIHADNSNARR